MIPPDRPRRTLKVMSFLNFITAALNIILHAILRPIQLTSLVNVALSILDGSSVYFMATLG